MNLRGHFITFDAPFVEGAVYSAEQKVGASNVKKATLFITALGVFSARIDGKKIGDEILAPGYTYYPHDLHYLEYDVTNMIMENSILHVDLGQGWYCGRFTFENKVQIYGEMPAVSWELDIETESGTQNLFSDSDNVLSVPSHYEYAGLYDGEIYRADGFSNDAYRIKKYDGALPDVIEKASVLVRTREKMPVLSVSKCGDVTIVDFGQNFAGIIEIDPSKMNGDTLTLRHGEILCSNGSLYTSNLRRAKQQIVYHKGKTSEKYRPEFTYMGFRYVELTGADYVDGLITAYAVYSDMERTGSFRCENELVRMGYTGDGHVFAETGAYNYDTLPFWNKFLKDIRFSQSDSKDGYVTPTVPAAPGRNNAGFMSMLGWGNCICIVPDMLYRQYGDKSVLERNYDSMKAFADCEIGKTGGLLGKKDLWIAPSLGDWLALGKDVKYMALHNGPVSNAFLVNDMKIMSSTAKLLGKTADAEKYAAQYEKSKAAYVKAFIKDGRKMKDDYQGAYVMALKFVVDKGEMWDALYSTLREKISVEGMQTGFFATEHLLPLLCDNGDEKLAFDLLLSEKCPGWMYQVKRGATTTWERWDAIREDGTVNETKMSSDNMVSFNHYSFGSVGKFYYKYILGISPAEPGFEKVHIAPHVDERIGSFEGSYLSRHGKITVKYDDISKELTVDVPVCADVCFNGKIASVKQGKHVFSAK